MAEKPPLKLSGICRLAEEINRFLQIRANGLDRVTLARDIELGTEPYISVAFTINDRTELLHFLGSVCPRD
jgi:hypothetical protein